MQRHSERGRARDDSCYNPCIVNNDSPMNPTERIRAQFTDSAQLKHDAAEALAPRIASAAGLMVECLLANGKVLACGNGGSAGDAQHFAAEMIGRFERERPELPAISLATDTSILTAVANDYSF